MNSIENTAKEILQRTKVEVSPETYALVGLSHDHWRLLLENAALSPRMTAPFMIFSDKWEVTLMLDEVDFETMHHAIREARIERGFRLLTFDIELDFSVVGFLSAISKILAEAEIPLVALSAYSRDHLLVKQEHLAKTLKTLGAYVKELC